MTLTPAARCLPLFLLAACSEPATLQVGETGLMVDTGTDEETDPDIVVSTNLIEFGEVGIAEIDDTSATVTVENGGEQILHISGISQTGSSSFSVGDVPSQDVPQGDDLVFEVHWTPIKPGTDEAVIELLSNDPDEPRYQILLTGKALGGQIAIGPDDRDLGEVAPGETIAEVVSIWNEGNVPVSIIDIDLDVGDGWRLPELDDLIEDVPVELAPDELIAYSIAFTPEGEGTSLLTITLTTDSSIDPEVSATFLATAGE